MEKQINLASKIVCVSLFVCYRMSYVLKGSKERIDACLPYVRFQTTFTNEPGVILRDGHCPSTNSVEIKPMGQDPGTVEYANLRSLIGSNGSPIGDKSIDVIIIPPNFEVDIFEWNDFKGVSDTLQAGVWADLSGTTKLGINNIGSIRVRRLQHSNNWVRWCCNGSIPAELCGPLANPYGADCKNIMSSGLACTIGQQYSYPWFFDEKYPGDPEGSGFSCKRWFAGLNDPLRNEIAKQVCASPNLTPERQKWCACFIARDIPPELANNPVVKSYWPCLDPICNDSSLSLQRYGSNCPSTLAICQQSDIRAAATQGSEIKSAIIQNACGNVNIGGPSGPSAPAGSLLDNVPKWQLAVGGGVLLFILISLGILVASVLRRK